MSEAGMVYGLFVMLVVVVVAHIHRIESDAKELHKIQDKLYAKQDELTATVKKLEDKERDFDLLLRFSSMPRWSFDYWKWKMRQLSCDINPIYSSWQSLDKLCSVDFLNVELLSKNDPVLKNIYDRTIGPEDEKSAIEFLSYMRNIDFAEYCKRSFEKNYEVLARSDKFILYVHRTNFETYIIAEEIETGEKTVASKYLYEEFAKFPVNEQNSLISAMLQKPSPWLK